MKTPRPPLFLERSTYRRRRMMDAARILPVVGFVLILLPVLWTHSGGFGTAGEAVYLFGLWGLLIVAAALLSAPLRGALRRDAQGNAPDTRPETRTRPVDGTGVGTGGGAERDGP
ncbi:hypothetical protein [Pararhodobacter marinus]|uniref:hypothetical protein n=1 Tax=Pararhodobacter marinus TaxID=2184063 RepID=UPI0035169FD6